VSQVTREALKAKEKEEAKAQRRQRETLKAKRKARAQRQLAQQHKRRFQLKEAQVRDMAATVRDPLDLPQIQTKCLKFLSTGNGQVQKCVQILRDYGRTPKSKRKVVGFFDMEGTKLKAPYSASLVAPGFDETCACACAA
jgi:hypothetical protein